MITKINLAVAAGGLTIWGWLPYLQNASDVAAALVPFVTLGWIIYQWRKSASSK